ncbi:MAG TPA: aldolase/citrate lyase family protein [Steroidobacteraceae bacterium]
MLGKQSDAQCRENPALQKLAQGIPLLSLGIRNARSSEIVRMAKTAGFGLVWIDLEHSSISTDCAAQIIASAADLGLEGWARIPEREYGVIGRLLDGGATGIIAPRIETTEEAQKVVNAARFPPRGQRSQIALLPQAKYQRVSAAELMRCADLATTVHILIESAEGVRNSDAIAAIDGVDVLHVGMNDLSVDLGHVDDLRHADMLDACRRVIAAAHGCGKLAVVGGCSDPVQCLELLNAGAAPLVFAAIDTDVLAAGLGQRATQWEQLMQEWCSQTQASIRSNEIPG